MEGQAVEEVERLAWREIRIALKGFRIAFFVALAFLLLFLIYAISGVSP